MQRFLYSMPLSRVGSRSFFKPEIPKALLDEYDALITAFLRLDAKEPLREITLTPYEKNKRKCSLLSSRRKSASARNR